MARPEKSIHGEWSSRWAFILAATGSAVGLGNIWKFPYITGENGGGAFVLIYLLCIAIIGIPVMMAEIMLGRRGRQNPANSLKSLAIEEGKTPHWKWLGWIGVIAGFLILSYYSVIAGVVLAYVFRTIAGIFEGVTPDGVASIFNHLMSDPERLLAWHTIFMVLTMYITSRGVRHGLEKAVRFLMPALFAILLVLIAYAVNTGEAFQHAVNFMFEADFSKIDSHSVLTAMGHAFFTLSLGMGAIMVYGSYLPQKSSISKVSLAIAAMDTLVALLAGLAIFPLVFVNGLDVGTGPGLIFKTLPIAFGHMPGGLFFGGLFFVLLFFAALSSAISLIEPLVAWMVETMKLTRVYASALAGMITWLVGLLTVFSFNITADWTWSGKTMFDLLDFLTANIMLPLGGFMIAVFAGWQMVKQNSQSELATWSFSYAIWRFLIRYITPVAILLVFANVIGLLS